LENKSQNTETSAYNLFVETSSEKQKRMDEGDFQQLGVGDEKNKLDKLHEKNSGEQAFPADAVGLEDECQDKKNPSAKQIVKNDQLDQFFDGFRL